MTALQYLESKGFEYKLSAGQAVVKTCPYCNDQKGHFYMDQADGRFYCHKCNKRGNLITLQKYLGDYEPGNGNRPGKPQGIVQAAFHDERTSKFRIPNKEKVLEAHQCLLSDAEALQYMKDRTISLETLKVFKIGLQIDKNGNRWLTIPHFEKDKLINIKSRTLPPAEKAFRRVKDCRSILFNNDAIEENHPELYLCEGEIDVLTLWNAGIKNVIGGTTGAPSFDPAWIDQLRDVRKIILVYDSDEVGQKGAREVARRLGYERTYNVVLPEGQDINDFFRAGNSADDFVHYVGEHARRFDVAGIMTFEEGLKKLREEALNPNRETGIRTGFGDVDRIIKTGFLPGELVVLSSPPKIGKSTWALQVTTHNALQGIPSLFFCLEMRPQKVIQKIVQRDNRAEEIGIAEYEKTRFNFQGAPLYLGYCHQNPTLEGIIATLKDAIKRYGLKLVAFDHLHFLCRSITNQVQEIGQAVQAFKFLAEELEIPIILIAQPRKIQADSIMTAMDLKDSASIFSDCDHLIILHRVRCKGNDGELATEAYDPETLVRVEASRYNAGGECMLYYHGACSFFEKLS